MTLISTPLQARLHEVEQQIHVAERRFSRVPGSVRLLAVSKTWPAADVAQLVTAGQISFGENYLQEGVAKIDALAQAGYPALDWHFIGPLQSNKTRQIAENFSWVHSLDRVKIAERLSRQRPCHLSPLKILVQVNLSGESGKSGCAYAQTEALCRVVTTLPRLELVGLMAIPKETDDFTEQRAAFGRLRILSQQLCERGLPLPELSMGMSHDLEAAIAEGATWVRVGTAIFGARDHRVDNA